MDFTYDLTTSTGQVRLLIADTDGDGYDFTDAEIAAALGLEGGSVRYAAAMLLDALASNRARLSVRVARGSGVSEDLTQVAAALHVQAASLREQAAAGDEGGPLEMTVTPTLERFSAWGNAAYEDEPTAEDLGEPEARFR
jgi:hypothetical protein